MQFGHEIALSPDGTQLAVSAGQTVQIIDLSSRKVSASRSMQDAVDVIPCAMAFSPDAKVVAVARVDRIRVKVYEIELCDPRTLRATAVLKDKVAAAVASLNYSPSGSLLAGGTDDGTVIIWDLTAGKPRRKLDLRRPEIRRTRPGRIFRGWWTTRRIGQRRCLAP